MVYVQNLVLLQQKLSVLKDVYQEACFIVDLDTDFYLNGQERAQIMSTFVRMPLRVSGGSYFLSMYIVCLPLWSLVSYSLYTGDWVSRVRISSQARCYFSVCDICLQSWLLCYDVVLVAGSE